MEVYQAIRCNSFYTNSKLDIMQFGVQHFPQSEALQNLAREVHKHIEEWGITCKEKCLLTDAASNMIECTLALKIRHPVCFLKKTIDQIPSFPSFGDISTNGKQIVTHFFSSPTGGGKRDLYEDTDVMR